MFTKHTLFLVVVLVAFWLLWSGHYTGLLISLGAVSVVLVVWTCHRMDVVDNEGQPLALRLTVLIYWLWLAGEIVKSSIDVAKRVLFPGKGITPIVARMKASQKTLEGRVTYANSITLTPGTVTIDINNEELIVHALTLDGISELHRGEMDRRVTAIERDTA